MLAAQDHKKPSSYSLLHQHIQKLQHMHSREPSSGSPRNSKPALVSRYIHPYLPTHKCRALPLPFHCLEAIYNITESSTFLLFEPTLVASVDMNCKSHPAQILCHELAYKQKHHRLSSCPANQLVFQKVFTALTF